MDSILAGVMIEQRINVYNVLIEDPDFDKLDPLDSWYIVYGEACFPDLAAAASNECYNLEEAIIDFVYKRKDRLLQPGSRLFLNTQTGNFQVCAGTVDHGDIGWLVLKPINWGDKMQEKIDEALYYMKEVYEQYGELPKYEE